MIAPAAFRQFSRDRQQCLALRRVVLLSRREFLNPAAERHSQRHGEPVTYREVARDLLEVGGLVGQFAPPLSRLLMPKPVLEAALFPLAQVLLADRASTKFLRENLLHIRKSV